MTEKLPISVIVPVRNEERNLPACLESVRFADEVFVVDSRSVDATIPIASQHGARVVQFDHVSGGPRKKNWSLDNLPLRNEWALLIDADERVTPELEAEIRAEFGQPGGPRCDGYYLNRSLIFLGRWLRHGGNYPSWNLRLLRRDAGRYESLGTEDLQSAGDVEVHEHIRLEGKAGYLKSPLLHEDFKTLEHWIERHNRYSTWDARMRVLLGRHELADGIRPRLFGDPIERKRFLKTVWVRLPAKPVLRLVYMYLVRWGFLDGMPGFLYCCLKAAHELQIEAKIFEARQRQESQPTPLRQAA